MPPLGELGLREAVRRSEDRTGFWILPFTVAAWIAPRPQQVGLSVIPTGSRHSRVGGNLPLRDWTHCLESCRPLAVMPQKVNGTFLDCSFAFGVDCLYNHSENPMRGSGCHE